MFDTPKDKASGGTMYKPIIDSPQQTPRRHTRPKIPLSIITIIILVLSLQFIFLPRYIYKSSPASIQLTNYHLEKLNAGLQRCAQYHTPPIQYPVTTANSRSNARWNPKTGQNRTNILLNVTLFDGENILGSPVNIVFDKGIITKITHAKEEIDIEGAFKYDFQGHFVTPGLVDMHSHHMAMTWPLLSATDDTNEVNKETGPITSQVRILDSLKAYDIATEIIASGGVTTSLILPGSANVMGGEAVLVKNALKRGGEGELVVEDMLLEHGLPKGERRRFMKMACGENPRRVYTHTRMGNAWVFRKHMERAQELRAKQDEWCLEAAVMKESGDLDAVSKFLKEGQDSEVDYLEYDSSIAMLRGQVGVNVHCYEPEDFEDMLLHSKEFGFRIQAFHHALAAWEVPEMIKASGENITIATFAAFGYYKKEAYEANLWAGSILAEHGVPVAYKSDHVQEETNAKYLLTQAATAHAFNLSEILALQSVTSVPARSLEIDHRVGYVRAGYDADLVVWDSHPLSVGATALHVFVDGIDFLDPKKTKESLSGVKPKFTNPAPPVMKKVPTPEVKKDLCEAMEKKGAKFTITGLTESFLDTPSASSAQNGNLTLVIENGKIICLSTPSDCLSASTSSTIISLQNGHLLPGLTTVSVSLGLQEIAGERSTGDGKVSTSVDLDPKKVFYAKYGIHLEGKGFSRAKYAGVTKAVTAPLARGFVGGVSVGIKTSGKKGVLDGGVFREDVALHFGVGGRGYADSLPTVSSGIGKLRQIIIDSQGKDDVYGRAANGSFPLVVDVDNEYDIQQLIKIKQELPAVNLVIHGGAGAPLVAKELAAAGIPVILTRNRGAPDSYEKLNALPGPPLSRLPAAVLAEAGVKFGLAMSGENDAHIHDVPIEAGWAAKFAGLSSRKAIDLVSRNIEEILGLDIKEEERDFVVYEGNPLEYGARVVVAVDGMDGSVSACWPETM